MVLDKISKDEESVEDECLEDSIERFYRRMEELNKELEINRFVFSI